MNISQLAVNECKIAEKHSSSARHNIGHECYNNSAYVREVSRCTFSMHFYFKNESSSCSLIIAQNFSRIFSLLHLEIHQVQLIVAISRTMKAIFLLCRHPKFRPYGRQWWEPLARATGAPALQLPRFTNPKHGWSSFLPDRAAVSSASEFSIPAP